MPNIMTTTPKPRYKRVEDCERLLADALMQARKIVALRANGRPGAPSEESYPYVLGSAKGIAQKIVIDLELILGEGYGK